MGFPHATYDVPGCAPELATLVERAVVDPLDHRALLAAGLRGDPAVAAGHVCVTAWVLDGEGRRTLLVAHRSLGWVEPGGHLEVGEEPATGAARELFEETGLALAPALEAPALVHGGVFPRRGGAPAHHHWNIAYLFVADPRAELHPEPGAPLGWFPVDALPQGALPDLAVILPPLAELVSCLRP